MPPPEQFTYQLRQQDMLRQRADRRMSVPRIICGMIWAVIGVILGAGAVLELTSGNVPAAVLCLVMAVGVGWYDYRVWTYKAKRLLFIP